MFDENASAVMAKGIASEGAAGFDPASREAFERCDCGHDASVGRSGR